MRITPFLYWVFAGVLAPVGLFVSQQRATMDWPQFRGPNRDGVAGAFDAPARWPDSLVRQWKVEVGAGHASPILVGNRVYVFARRGEREVMQALDAATGKTVWETGYEAAVTVNPAAKAHGPGPKSTPTFTGGRLYTLGMGGIVTAFDATKGNILWQVPGTPVRPLYGTAASPLVDRGLVIVHVGGHDQGALTAFDAMTGKPRWAWSGDGPSYASAMPAEIDGVRQVITLTQKNVVGLAADTGSLLWQRPFSTEYDQNIITPLVAGRTVIISGYQKPTAALTVTKKGTAWTVDEAWNNPAVSLYMADAVTSGGSLFGLSHRNSGQYFLLDLKSGKTTWTGQPRQAENAAIVRANDVIFALETDAELVVGKAGADGFQESKRYKVADTATWAQPAISGNRIFVKDASTLALWTLR
jgi:outer membrane protein assembly factor BamB